jgi:acyl-CoA thioesterase FadM
MGKCPNGILKAAGLPPAKVLTLHSEPLRQEWIDAYGHLNQANYLIPFSNASWVLQEKLGVGRSYFAETACAIYTVETHILYRAEVRAPAQLTIETAILDWTDRRFSIAHRMLVDDQEKTVFETVVAHVNTKTSRSTPMPVATQILLLELGGSAPPWAVGGVSLSRRARSV